MIRFIGSLWCRVGVHDLDWSFYRKGRWHCARPGCTAKFGFGEKRYYQQRERKWWPRIIYSLAAGVAAGVAVGFIL